VVSTARHDLTKDCAAAQLVGMRARAPLARALFSLLGLLLLSCP